MRAWSVGFQRVNVSDAESYAAHHGQRSVIVFNVLEETGASVLYHIAIAANRRSLIGLLGRIHVCLHWE